MEEDSDRSDADENAGSIAKTDELRVQIAREPSPEMARISALITRPPKQKSSKQRKFIFSSNSIASNSIDSSWKTTIIRFDFSIKNYIEQNADFNSPIRNEYFDASVQRNDYHSTVASSTPLIATPSGRGRPKGSSSLKGSKKSSKASTSFSVAASTVDLDKKSISFADNPSTGGDSQMNLMNAADEQVNI